MHKWIASAALFLILIVFLVSATIPLPQPFSGYVVPINGAADLGAKLNAALAAISYKGEIDIPWVTSGWTITTPVVITNPTGLRIVCLGYKGGGFNGPGVIHDGITGTAAANMITISGSTASSLDALIENCRFQGNGLTGTSGNGNALAILNDMSLNYSPIGVTLRNNAFYGFMGTGRDVTGASMPAAAIYASNGHEIRIIDTDRENNQYGIRFDTCFKCTISGGISNNNNHNGLMVQPNPVYFGPSENIEVINHAIFNLDGLGGGATDAAIYATDFYHFDILTDRFKANFRDVLTGSFNNIGLTINYNHFYHGSSYGTNASIDLYPSTGNVQICGDTEFVDNTSVNSVWLHFEPSTGGYSFNSAKVCNNRATLSQGFSGNLVAKWIWIELQTTGNFVLEGNEFGDYATPGALSITSTTAYYVDSPNVTSINDSCVVAAGLTLSKCFQFTANASKRFLIEPTCISAGGTLTTCRDESAALGSPHFQWKDGCLAIGEAIGDCAPSFSGIETQGTYAAPATSGTTPNGNACDRASNSIVMCRGIYSAGYGWIQVQSQTNLAVMSVLQLSPKGGGVTIGEDGTVTASSAWLQLAGTGLQLIGGSPPTCGSGERGTFNVVGSTHSASVADIVQICAADATDTYAWRAVGHLGFSGTITTAKLTSGGSNGSMTFVNGILTAQVAAN